MNEPAELERPRLIAADHVSFTVPDLAAAIAFYADAFGATELFRMGPLVGAQIPPLPDGRDWMGAHVGVEGATLTLAMLRLADNLNLQLVQYDAPADRGTTPPRVCDAGGHHLGLRVDDVVRARAWLAAKGCTMLEIIEISDGPLAGKKNLYCRDPFGNPLEIVD